MDFNTLVNNVILLSLISALFGAFVNIMARKILVNDKYSFIDFLPVNFFFTLVILLVIVPWFWHFIPGPYTYYWLIVMLLVDFAGNWLGFKGLSQLKASTYSLIIAFSPLVTIILIGILDGASALSFFVVLGSIITIIGLVLVIKSKNGSSTSSNKSVLISVAAMILMGIGVYLNKHFMVSGDISSFSFLVIRYTFLFISISMVFRPKKWQTCIALNWKLILTRSIFVIVQWWTLSQALLVGDVIVVKSITDSVPIFVAIIGILTGFEKPNKLEAFGVIIATLGIMAIIYFS